MQKLVDYFTRGLVSAERMVGMEVETSFVSSTGPATIDESQGVFATLVERGWMVTQRKGPLISVITDKAGNAVLYELGRQNLEIATAPGVATQVVGSARRVLDELYEAARTQGLEPYFVPILETTEDLLVIPDERDATWLSLDGRVALAPLAKISAVQFTIDVSLEEALPCLNRLGASIGTFLADYPQDAIWRTYIRDSLAGYDARRYGGPLLFSDLDDYCRKLSMHSVVKGTSLVPFTNVESLDIPLFLRSVWWYFRLRRYGNRLCIEVRPLARRTDAMIETQFDLVRNIMRF